MDRHNFSQVARENAVRWRRIAFLISGDWGRAEDMVQEALLRMYRQWHRIDVGGVDAYARRVLSRLAIDEARRRERRGEVFGPVPERPAAGSAVDDVVDVRAAIARVPPRQRAVLVLRYYGGLSVAETAAALRISEGTVKSQCARGLNALRAALGESAREGQTEAGELR
ncbi:SigE family RNA polymerase sigma factor [Actinokineospora sp.]|uniref:SigE family RNA polymerase sigma factor n=1 Tax=Actinokineospora sp. TaxID=1872133 RepID=UPI003D6A41EC